MPLATLRSFWKFGIQKYFVQVQIAGMALRGADVGTEENQLCAVRQHNRVAF
jgi:hypothetical protein